MSEYAKRSRGEGASRPPRRGSGRKRAGPRPADLTGEEALQGASGAEGWTDSLKSIQESIDGATGAMNLLRSTLQELAPMWRSLSQIEEVLREGGRSLIGATPGDEGPAADVPESNAVAVEAAPVEPALAAEAGGPAEAAAVSPRVARAPVEAGATRPAGTGSGVHSYTLTVEDTRGKVELVPLHRALRSVPGVRDMTLLGYTHGIATIVLDARADLEAPALEAAIADTTTKQCKIWARSADTFLVRVGA